MVLQNAIMHVARAAIKGVAGVTEKDVEHAFRARFSHYNSKRKKQEKRKKEAEVMFAENYIYILAVHQTYQFGPHFQEKRTAAAQDSRTASPRQTPDGVNIHQNADVDGYLDESTPPTPATQPSVATAFNQTRVAPAYPTSLTAAVQTPSLASPVPTAVPTAIAAAGVPTRVPSKPSHIATEHGTASVAQPTKTQAPISGAFSCEKVVSSDEDEDEDEHGQDGQGDPLSRYSDPEYCISDSENGQDS